MLSNTLFKKNKTNSLYYYLKHKLYKKYKKINKHNKYSKIYNPRKEFNICDNVFIKKHKFYTINKNN